MVSFTEQRLEGLLGSIKGKKVAVVGDLMVDRYYWGHVGRISPEAPVPVVEVEQEQVRLGGAANVANNIQTLGGDPILVGLIVDDHPGKLFPEILKERNLSSRAKWPTSPPSSASPSPWRRRPRRAARRASTATSCSVPNLQLR